jgi:hypothetical protein
MANKIAASFNGATLAPIGSLARLNQAEEWILAAMYAVNDSAVAYAHSQLQGWRSLGRMSPAASACLDTLMAECTTYLESIPA